MLAIGLIALISGWSVYRYLIQDGGDHVSGVGNLNISWFVFRDVDRDGVYDMDERPYAGLRIRLERPDGETISSLSNVSGFANFKMSIDPKKGVISEEGTYRLSANPPPGWQVTSGAETVDVEFVFLGDSPAGIVAASTPDPLGVAPVPRITGWTEAGDSTIIATDPSGEQHEVKTDRNGSFEITGNTGTWLLASGTGSADTGQTTRIDVHYYPIVLSRSFLTSSDEPSKGREITTGYDDLTMSERVYKIPNGYRGLKWKDWIATHSLLYGGAGYVNATISSDYVAYNSSGHPGFISSDRSFDFIETYIGIAWPKAAKGDVRVEGYRAGELVYNDNLKLSHWSPVHFYANYLNITSLKIYSDIYWQVILEDSRFRLRE